METYSIQDSNTNTLWTVKLNNKNKEVTTFCYLCKGNKTISNNIILKYYPELDYEQSYIICPNCTCLKGPRNIFTLRSELKFYYYIESFKIDGNYYDILNYINNSEDYENIDKIPPEWYSLSYDQKHNKLDRELDEYFKKDDDMINNCYICQKECSIESQACHNCLRNEL